MSDLRLIEDYLPIEAISAEASREKSVRKGHISTLHLWWARRPLVACRAAVYGALVRADRWVSDLNMKEESGDNGKTEAKKNGKKRGLNRRQAKEFVTRLCRYTSESKPEIKADTERAITDAQKHILEAHATRLTDEIVEWRNSGVKPGWIDEFKFTGDTVADADIEAGRAPRPRVLDMFAGGGAIPLEALRLGCEAYALDLNPVAHIIQLCTLVYPQKYGRPDPNERGMTGEKNSKGETTWGGLAEEVRYWGNYVLKEVKKEIGDLYPPIPDPEFKGKRSEIVFDRKTGNWVEKGKKPDKDLFGDVKQDGGIPKGYLQPVAYLWTRTVKCKNPGCGATVPLVKQTWLCKKDDRFVALKMIAPRNKKIARFEVIEAKSENKLGFDPEDFSSGGNATCPFCGTVADIEYVKDEGWQGRMGVQALAIVGTRAKSKGKVYLPENVFEGYLDISLQKISTRLKEICEKKKISVPHEPIANLKTDCKDNSLGITVRPYGIRTFGDLFTARQTICLLSFSSAVRDLTFNSGIEGNCKDLNLALKTCLAAIVDRLADFNSMGCTWNYTGGRGVLHAMASQRITMTWDFTETNPFNPAGASWVSGIEDVPCAFEQLASTGMPAIVIRGSSTDPILENGSIDAVVTDPPYYDNVPYSDISDYFYVWLKRTIGQLYPTHFASEETPKKKEAIADSTRHGGDMDAARLAYENMITMCFAQAYNALKKNGQMSVVYRRVFEIDSAFHLN
jgi:putative DNA methylase